MAESHTRFDLAALKAGDDLAWTFVVRELSGPLLGLLRLRGSDDPENLLGEVFHNMARGLDGFEGDWTTFRNWAFTIARRRSIDTYRYHARRPTVRMDVNDLIEALLKGGDVEAEAMEQLGLDWLQDLFATLTPLQRDVVTLRFVSELSVKDVASILNLSETAVKAHTRRARTKLEQGYVSLDSIQAVPDRSSSDE